MNFVEAFQSQIEHTKPLTLEDIEYDPLDDLPVTWNTILITLDDGNQYSSGRHMAVGDIFLIAYIIENTDRPQQLFLEKSEIEHYSTIFDLVRITGYIPVITPKKSKDYIMHEWQEEI